MSNLTVSQLVHIFVQIVGACFLIVIVSYPIQSFFNYTRGEAQHQRQVQQADEVSTKASSWIPSPIARILGTSKPANTLVPPPPPLMY